MTTYFLLPKSKRIFTLLFFVFLLQIYTVALTIETKTVEPPLLRVGYIPLLSQLPLIISYDRNRLSYQRIRVNLTRFSSYIALEAAFRTQAIDIAYLPIPTILKMKAEGVAVLMGDALHRHGSSLVATPGVQKKDGQSKVFGIPALSSSEHLILEDYFSTKGLHYGTDYKVVTVQLNRAIDELERNNLDGLILPEPYPTMAAIRLKDKIQYISFKTEDYNGHQGHQSALAFNRNFVSAATAEGIVEWLKSVQQACNTLEKDLNEFGGAQTVITQHYYFNFDKLLVQKAFAHSHGSMRFGAEKIPKAYLKQSLKKLMHLRLLLKSVTLDDLFLDSVMKGSL